MQIRPSIPGFKYQTISLSRTTRKQEMKASGRSEPTVERIGSLDVGVLVLYRVAVLPGRVWEMYGITSTTSPTLD